MHLHVLHQPAHAADATVDHGALLVANRPRRAAAAAADRAIDATLTEQRKAPRTAPLRDITNLPAALQ